MATTAELAEAAKAEEAKAAEAAKSAAGKTGEDGAANQNLKGDTVPVKALTEERGKRQALESKIQQLETMSQDQIAYDAVGNPV